MEFNSTTTSHVGNYDVPQLSSDKSTKSEESYSSQATDDYNNSSFEKASYEADSFESGDSHSGDTYQPVDHGIKSKYASQNLSEARRESKFEPDNIETTPIVINDKYILKKIIGNGSFSKVWYGTESTTGRDFAVKVMKSYKSDNSIDAQRRQKVLMNEIKILLYLQQSLYKNISRFVDWFEHSEKLYLITPLMRGGTLLDRITKAKPYSEKFVSGVIFEITNNLKKLHENGIIHRDIKPSNVMYESNTIHSSLHIIDFGLSVLNNDCVTGTKIVGSPAYISPEILRNREYTVAGDVWSLGVILYILLAGSPPFHGKSRNELFIMTDAVFGCISNAAKDLLRRMLHIDPTLRISTAEILEHRWIKHDMFLSETPIYETFTRLQEYTKQRRYKANENACIWGSDNRIFHNSLDNSMSIVNTMPASVSNIQHNMEYGNSHIVAKAFAIKYNPPTVVLQYVHNTEPEHLKTFDMVLSGIHRGSEKDGIVYQILWRLQKKFGPFYEFDKGQIRNLVEKLLNYTPVISGYKSCIDKVSNNLDFSNRIEVQDDKYHNSNNTTKKDKNISLSMPVMYGLKFNPPAIALQYFDENAKIKLPRSIIIRIPNLARTSNVQFVFQNVLQSMRTRFLLSNVDCDLIDKKQLLHLIQKLIDNSPDLKENVLNENKSVDTNNGTDTNQMKPIHMKYSFQSHPTAMTLVPLNTDVQTGAGTDLSPFVAQLRRIKESLCIRRIQKWWRKLWNVRRRGRQFINLCKEKFQYLEQQIIHNRSSMEDKLNIHLDKLSNEIKMLHLNSTEQCNEILKKKMDKNNNKVNDVIQVQKQLKDELSKTLLQNVENISHKMNDQMNKIFIELSLKLNETMGKKFEDIQNSFEDFITTSTVKSPILATNAANVEAKLNTDIKNDELSSKFVKEYLKKELSEISESMERQNNVAIKELRDLNEKTTNDFLEMESRWKAVESVTQNLNHQSKDIKLQIKTLKNDLKDVPAAAIKLVNALDDSHNVKLNSALNNSANIKQNETNNVKETRESKDYPIVKDTSSFVKVIATGQQTVPNLMTTVQVKPQTSATEIPLGLKSSVQSSFPLLRKHTFGITDEITSMISTISKLSAASKRAQHDHHKRMNLLMNSKTILKPNSF
eukprot:GSMAST32.ASY1.ANO1.1188.1 assembled CDS